MTRGQLITKVRENLNDWAVTYYNEDDLIDSIQDAYDEIVVYSECYERVIDLPASLINASPWVNLKSLIPDYYRIVAILNKTSREFLCSDSHRNEDFYKNDWQIHNVGVGNLFVYLINGCEWVAFPNGYTNIASNKDLRVFYKASAPLIEDDTHIFKILTEYQKLLEYYVTADLLEQNQELQKAMHYWNMYEPLLEQYRRKILLLPKADRIFTREAVEPYAY